MSQSAVKRLVQEISQLKAQPHEGIHLIENDEDITDIQAYIQGPQGTPYENGLFKVKLQIGSDYPNSPPKGYFITKIFHPNVSKSGEICVNTLKKDWTKDLGISRVLLTIKCLLIVPNPDSALNEEAGRLLLEEYESYASQAKLWTSIHANQKLEALLEKTDSKMSLTNENALLADKTNKQTVAAPQDKKRSLRRL